MGHLVRLNLPEMILMDMANEDILYNDELLKI
jgi:hypothetical protein